jgi:hypothetical protein
MGIVSSLFAIDEGGPAITAGYYEAPSLNRVVEFDVSASVFVQMALRYYLPVS